MTLPLEQSMEGGRARAKPISELAVILASTFYGRPVSDEFVHGVATGGYVYNQQAKAAFAYLVSHGFITIEGLLAMKAETEAKSPQR